MVHNKERYLVLDVLRFILALFVVIYHLFFRGGVTGDRVVESFSLIEILSKYGFLGVQGFFIISGFVISLSAKNKTPYEFCISRALRLYPAFWICCIFTYIILAIDRPFFWDITFFEFLRNLTMMEGFFQRKYVDGVYWTLTVELLFYFYIFLMIVFKVFNDRMLFGLSLLWSIMSCATYVLDMQNSFLAKVLILNYSSYFCLGVLLYIYKDKKFDVRSFLAIFLAFGACYLETLNKARELSERFGYFYNHWVMLAFVFSVFLVIRFFSRREIDLPAAKYLAFLGASTYPLYLLHQNIGYVVINNFATYSPPETIAVFVLLLMVVTALVVSMFLEPRARSGMKVVVTKIEKIIF
ncbi:acyltransferase [Chromohalobacter sp. 48-RD10]|uniref:acyltransferase family protein n=1 Tax=Chromohalobacter sp. 48-RD10 TaxID=2994063 RepID=UPI00246892E6|nr:acyltransferase [Chromohalobacter sp. 48-RD10]